MLARLEKSCKKCITNHDSCASNKAFHKSFKVLALGAAAMSDLDKECDKCKQKIHPKAVVCNHCSSHQGLIGRFSSWQIVLGVLVSLIAAYISIYQAYQATRERIEAEEAMKTAQSAQLRAEEVGKFVTLQSVEMSIRTVMLGVGTFDQCNDPRAGWYTCRPVSQAVTDAHNNILRLIESLPNDHSLILNYCDFLGPNIARLTKIMSQSPDEDIEKNKWFLQEYCGKGNV